jgi:hypothetical protein
MNLVLEIRWGEFEPLHNTIDAPVALVRVILVHYCDNGACKVDLATDQVTAFGANGERQLKAVCALAHSRRGGHSRHLAALQTRRNDPPHLARLDFVVPPL